jgi:Peroxisomal biogenesis factor 11 (PEX11)
MLVAEYCINTLSRKVVMYGYTYLAQPPPFDQHDTGMTERSHSPALGPPAVPPRHSKAPDPLKIINNVLLVTDGRDKIVKLLQYSSRLILLLSTRPTKRLKPFISEMSMTRKVLKLGHGIFPYNELVFGGCSTKHDLLRVIVEFINDFWDDVYCLSRIGVFRSAKLQLLSETWANRAWMMSILIDLNAAMKKRAVIAEELEPTLSAPVLNVPGTEDSIEKLKVDAFWADISIVKLLADFGFCGVVFVEVADVAIDVFQLEVHDGYQTCLGLASGVLRYCRFLRANA